MGEIDKKDIRSLLLNIHDEVLSYLDTIDNMTHSDKIVMIIVLSQYLYAIYCKYGKDLGNKYRIFASDIRTAISDRKFSEMAVTIIVLRNEVCHNYNSNSMKHLLDQVFSDIDLLNDFLKYILSQADLQITLLKMNGGL